MSLSLLVVAYFATWICLFFTAARTFFWLLDLADKYHHAFEVREDSASRGTPRNLGRLHATHLARTALWTRKGGDR